MRAVADNTDLARLKGIDPRRLSNLATFLGMGLAGVGGSLLAIDTSVDPINRLAPDAHHLCRERPRRLDQPLRSRSGRLVDWRHRRSRFSRDSPVYQSLTAFIAILVVLLIKPTGLFAGAAESEDDLLSVFIGTLTAIYALLSLGLVVSWGQAGMVNLGLVGLFGLALFFRATHGDRRSYRPGVGSRNSSRRSDRSGILPPHRHAQEEIIWRS